MATARIGESGPIFGTTDQSYGVIENVEATTEVNEEELTDGDGDIIAVDQHGKKTTCTFEYTYKTSADGPDLTDVGTGTAINVPDGGTYGIPSTIYLRSATATRSKAPGYLTIRCEGTSWPSLGS